MSTSVIDPERILNPLRHDMTAACFAATENGASLPVSDTLVPEVWERLASQEVIPFAWVRDAQRMFCSETRQEKIEAVVCPSTFRYFPPTVTACVAFGSDVPGVLAVEHLAREASTLLGIAQNDWSRRIVWYCPDEQPLQAMLAERHLNFVHDAPSQTPPVGRFCDGLWAAAYTFKVDRLGAFAWDWLTKSHPEGVRLRHLAEAVLRSGYLICHIAPVGILMVAPPLMGRR